MGRRRKGPWQRKGKTADKHWYTSIGRQTVKVADKSSSYEEAYQKYVELVADRGDASPNELLVKNLIWRFLKWTETNRSHSTFVFYQRYLNAFAKHHGRKRVSSLLPRHVERWVETEYIDSSPTTRNGIMKAVSRAINWGIQKRYLKHNPLVGMEKPTRSPRELVINQEQFTELLSHVPDAEFRDYLLFVWNTGCRAMEVRVIAKRHFDGSTITLPAAEAKGKKYPRVIYPNEVAMGII